ncbi:helix-turn-helix transcriptional regulator [Vibrio renipiscarius]|uniref:HTH luxR-type domain-containing protein n=1 Tax=Vibrio renipiscarius TaxID=1461322 RepID=A0A0C2NEQ3_9VIBR|nr:response regulator transcription factor [Vibrio renipiscarius]KII76402.1 hypothetical protein OJ16_16550 [Vibrio renipiscarius]KII78076.1 hypothetical protein PL18_14020 [Vibrio renipiscarius]
MTKKHVVILSDKNLNAGLIQRQLQEELDIIVSTLPPHQLVSALDEQTIDLVLIDFFNINELIQNNQIPNFDLLGVDVLVHNTPSCELDHPFLYWHTLRGILINTSPIHHLHQSVGYILSGGLWLPRKCLEKLVLIKRDPSLMRCDMYNSLTTRERQVLDHIAAGQSNKQIAKQLYLSESTIKSHIYRVYKKLDIHKRKDAVRMTKVIGSPQSD